MNSSFIRASAKMMGRVVGQYKKRHKASQPSVESPPSGEVSEQFRSPVFVETLFSCMGHLAGASGRVNEAEIAFARDLMQRLKLNDGQTKKAMLAFNKGKPGAWSMKDSLAALHQRYGDKQWVGQCFVEWQIRFCMADQPLQPVEKVLLAQMAEQLNINGVQFAALLGRAQPKRRQKKAIQRVHPLADDLAVFRLTAQAKWPEVKQAYRRLIAKHHPDRHPENEQVAKRINAAYHRLDQHWRQYHTFQ